ncbi:MAG TPA: outer membrane protein assembly factor BamC [Methylococcus sp.]|nr:outer membrane protein assembly factor BamC [Methylococcus sp.]
MNGKEVPAWVLCALLTTASGCSYVAGLFPDKQKQYRYHSEIPPLEIPPDLTSTTIEGAVAGGARDVAEKPAEPAEVPDPKSTLAEDLRDVPLIEVEAPFDEAWRSVVRALGRAKIEVTDEDRSRGVFDVRFGEPQTEQPGLLMRWLGLGGEASHSGAFRVHVEQKGQATVVFVTDEQDQPQTKGPGLDLLKAIHAQFEKSDANRGSESAEGEKSDGVAHPDQ